jgi:hypothetical protein
LYLLNKSAKLKDRIASGDRVQNTRNVRRGIDARRGDGTFGELIPGATPVWVPGLNVARGPIATVEIGVEVKILSKAMIRQSDRVMGNMEDQVRHFRAGRGQPIAIGVVGINHAERYTGYEGEKEWPTTGSGKYLHPVQEASAVEARIRARVAPHYDDLLFLRYRATNVPPYDFAWLDAGGTEMDYGAS